MRFRNLMKSLSVGIGMIALATAGAMARADVVTFGGLSGANLDPFTSAYTEGSFKVTPTAGDWFEGHVFGNLEPSIFNNIPSLSTIQLVHTSGGLFTFNQPIHVHRETGGQHRSDAGRHSPGQLQRHRLCFQYGQQYRYHRTAGRTAHHPQSERRPHLLQRGQHKHLSRTERQRQWRGSRTGQRRAAGGGRHERGGSAPAPQKPQVTRAADTSSSLLSQPQEAFHFRSFWSYRRKETEHPRQTLEASSRRTQRIMPHRKDARKGYWPQILTEKRGCI
jgi:hypothetical protein